MKNKHSVLRATAPTPHTASAGRAAEEGSGTVLALTIIAGVLILTVLTLGAAGAYTAHRRAAPPARPGGPPRPGRPDTMDVRVSVPITGPFAFLGDAKGQARAGAPDDTGDE